ncbi:unnamed protein product [Medioppia subpectinata]|uniref:ribonuclease H n=1 Tax=Medioppia subpectinata TaxID=1979941 RepID=A0A7R9KYP2_9ACAR|nr:unnamed protein product [Medioppia subpectinata]CAG2111981.1 unnamed protein product [Medioppia subpectinata]
MVKYYAVRIGRQPGVYNNWSEAWTQTHRYPYNQCKRFNTYEEAVDYVNGGPRSPATGEAVYDRNYWRPVPDMGCGNSYETCPERFQIYTDGACRGNGTASAIGGIGVHFPDWRDYISEPLPGRQTNICADIYAAKLAVKTAVKLGECLLEINTDSEFLVNSMTKWIGKWQQNGWKCIDDRPVKNKKDFLALLEWTQYADIVWTKVAAHSGIAGNERADRLAHWAIEDQLRRH